MAVIQGAQSGKQRTDVLAVHSIDHVVFTVPDIEEAVKFYTAFGMDVRRDGHALNIFTVGNPHCWMRVVENKQPKALQFLSFGIYFTPWKPIKFIIVCKSTSFHESLEYLFK